MLVFCYNFWFDFFLISPQILINSIFALEKPINNMLFLLSHAL